MYLSARGKQIGTANRDRDRQCGTGGARTFWAAALGYTVGDMDQDGTYLDLVPPEPGMPVVYLQRVPNQRQ